MAHNLNGYYFAQIDFNASNDSWTLGKNAAISTGDYGLHGSDSYDNIDVTVKGRIWGADAAILSNGDKIRVVVESTGQMSGEYGVYLSGAHCSVTNAGSILGTYGVQAAGEDIKINNTGLINAIEYGLYLNAAGGRFTNGKTGEVHSGEYGIYMSGGAIGEATRTVNHGVISGKVASFTSYDANDRLINDGKMIGAISTGAGNDTIDTRGGTIKGQIGTGLGDDKLYTDRASHKLTENAGEGTDTVYSTVTYTLSANVEILRLLGNKNINGTGTSATDNLHGNSGDNVLKGLAGIDALWGHKGNDRLYGGANIDYFCFATGDGKDVIMDFQDGTDRIDVEHWKAIANFNDLKNNHATQQGNDLLLHAGSDSILIKNFHKSQLDASDVDFGLF